MSSQNCPLGANIFNLKMYYIQYPVKKKKREMLKYYMGASYLNNVYEILNNNCIVFCV